MQDSFVGDVGDFANHGILRALCGTPAKPVDGLKLGVVEYFNRSTDADLKKSHGNRIEYLKVSKYNNSTYRVCDPELYDALRKLVGESLASETGLKIDRARARLLLPVDERYYDVALPVGERKDWLKYAIRKIEDNTDLIFVNPDIGIASKSQEEKVGPAHTTIKELSQIFENDKGVIVYQQIGQGLQRGQTAKDFIKQTSDRLMHELRPVCQLWVSWWRRGAGRAYFVVPGTERQRDKIEERLEAFKRSEWVKKGHFSVLCPSS